MQVIQPLKSLHLDTPEVKGNYEFLKTGRKQVMMPPPFSSLVPLALDQTGFSRPNPRKRRVGAIDDIQNRSRQLHLLPETVLKSSLSDAPTLLALGSLAASVVKLLTFR
jgi:hypothetical protein